MSKINVLEDFRQSETYAPKQLIIRDDEIPVIFFTPQAEVVTLHYCQEDELKSYVHCNGADCILCKIGRKPTDLALIPVYSPLEGRVVVLSVRQQKRPYDLYPQIVQFLDPSKAPRSVFISRQDSKFKVSSQPLEEDCDGGTEAIAAFLKLYDQDEEILSRIYPRWSNEDLLQVERIRQAAQLRGLLKE